MFGFVKMAAVSAVLSYGVVTVYEPAPAVGEAASSKLYHDRVLASDEAPVALSTDMIVRTAGSVSTGVASTGKKGDRLAASSDCAAQTWPYLSQDCVAAGSGGAQPKRVRVIAIENRIGPNTSVVAKAAPVATAQR